MSDGYAEMAASRVHWDARREAELVNLRAEVERLRIEATKLAVSERCAIDEVERLERDKLNLLNVNEALTQNKIDLRFEVERLTRERDEALVRLAGVTEQSVEDVGDWIAERERLTRLANRCLPLVRLIAQGGSRRRADLDEAEDVFKELTDLAAREDGNG